MAKTSKRQNKKIQIFLNVHSIELIKEYMNFPDTYDYDDMNSYSYKYEIESKTDDEKNLIKLFVTYQFKFKEDIILELTVRNDFKVKNYKEIIDQGRMMNPHFRLRLVEMSTNHLRGIQAYLTKGKPISHLLNPPISSEQIMSFVKSENNKD